MSTTAEVEDLTAKETVTLAGDYFSDEDEDANDWDDWDDDDNGDAEKNGALKLRF